MVWMARFSARSPPRLSRCRTILPLLAGMGLVPPRAANAASLRHRPGWEKLTTAWAAVTGPTPYRSVRPGAMLIWNAHHLQRVLTRYVEHYNTGRPHRGIDLDLPVPPPMDPATMLPFVGGVERVDVLAA